MVWGRLELRAGQCEDHECACPSLSIRNKQDTCQSIPNTASAWECSQGKQSGPRPGLQMLPDKINSFAPQQSDFSSPLLTPNLSRVKTAKVYTQSWCSGQSHPPHIKAKNPQSIAQLNHAKGLYSSAPLMGPHFLNIPVRKGFVASDDVQ